MQYLKLENITKTYGDKILFDGIDLTINKGDKTALLAKNGAGKTTLLKVISGLESPEGEQAKTEFAKNLQVGFLPQEPVLDDQKSILEELFSSEYKSIKAIKTYNQALKENNQALIEQSMAQIDELGAWSIEAQIKEILSKLNIEDLNQKIGVLSGGERKRVALTKILIENPDFLIFDEPTNHLDVEMIEWLEHYFKSPNKTLFVVTHDRYFINAVCNQIIELENGALQKYSGNYADYLEKKQAAKLNQAAAHQKLKGLYKKELEWVRRQPKARGTKSKDRVDRFASTKKALHSYTQEKKLNIDLKSSRLGAKIIEVINLNKAFDEKAIVSGFEYKFQKGDRIGIVGPNGAGKSTFLKLITKQLEPDKGKVILGETLNIGHYKQEGLTFKVDKRVIEFIRDIAEYIPLEKGKKLMAEQLLETFLFSRAQQQQYISTLSGGERKRLYLLSLLIQNPNFLILDEPTNDLDIATLNVLEDYLLSFKGCVMIVSHDRYFMDKLVDHLFVFKGAGEIKDFIGNYTDYSNQAKQEAQNTKIEKPQSITAPSKAKISHQQRKELRSIEKKLEKLEGQKTELETALLAPNQSLEEIQEKADLVEKLKAEISNLEDQWLSLSE